MSYFEKNGFRLTAEAEAERSDYDREHDGSCSCFISPPCSGCTHPGNPHNQNEEESCWEPDVEPAPAFDIMKSIRDVAGGA